MSRNGERIVSIHRFDIMDLLLLIARSSDVNFFPKYCDGSLFDREQALISEYHYIVTLLNPSSRAKR